MTPREEIAWLARRAGWGLAPGELDELVALGTDSLIDRMVDPEGAGIPTESSPWASMTFTESPDNRQEEALATLGAWIDHLVNTRRPFENSLAWFWHDHFAVSLPVVQHLPTFVAHLDLLRDLAMGSFGPLMRAVTTDAAMLIFLDGATSTGESPNENFGREMLELYTLGIGNYSEDDVRAAAVALTGWVVRRRFDFRVDFIPFRHDDSRQRFLGATGVHDVDTVLAAILAHQALPGFLAGKLGRFCLGDIEPGVVDGFAASFDPAADVAALGREILEAGVSGAGGPQVTAPVPWMVQVMKATGARPEPRAMIGLLRAMGQVPGNPPNVGGFPPASAWLSSSSTVARFTAANGLAQATPDEAPVLDAAAKRDWRALADLLLRPAGFSAPTLDALTGLAPSASRRPGEAALALALASPDLLIA